MDSAVFDEREGKFTALIGEEERSRMHKQAVADWHSNGHPNWPQEFDSRFSGSQFPAGNAMQRPDLAGKPSSSMFQGRTSPPGAQPLPAKHGHRPSQAPPLTTTAPVAASHRPSQASLPAITAAASLRDREVQRRRDSPGQRQTPLPVQNAGSASLMPRPMGHHPLVTSQMAGML